MSVVFFSDAGFVAGGLGRLRVVKIRAVTLSKTCIHFRLSDLWPPASNSLHRHKHMSRCSRLSHEFGANIYYVSVVRASNDDFFFLLPFKRKAYMGHSEKGEANAFSNDDIEIWLPAFIA